MKLDEQLKENFHKPFFNFEEVIGDIAPKRVLESVQYRIYKLTKFNSAVEELSSKPITQKSMIKINTLKSKITNQLISLHKEVKNARRKGYTITLPPMYEENVQSDTIG